MYIAIITIIFTSITWIISMFGYYFAYQFHAFDTVINNVILMLSFPVMDNKYSQFCKICILCENNCFPSNMEIIDGMDIQTPKSDLESPKSDDQIMRNRQKGEPTAMTIYETNVGLNHEMTETQNEGIKRNNNEPTMTTKIQEKNDQLIAIELGINAIDVYKVTKGMDVYQTPT